MKQVNLLPRSVRQQAANRQAAPFFVLSVLLAVLAVGASWYVIGRELESVQAQVVAKRAAEAAEAARVASEQQSLQVSADTAARVNQLNQFSQAEIDWSKAFSLVGTLIPQDVILNDFAYTTGQGSAVLKMAGKAPSSVSFAVFVESLRASSKLSAVKVEGFSYEAASGAVTFSVTVTVQPKEVVYLPS